jgi:hypothetical protein
MKKFLVTMLLVLAMAIPVFAQDDENVAADSSTIYYNKIINVWVSSGESLPWHVNTLLSGNILWETKATHGTTKYVMRVIRVATGKVIYTKVVTEPNVVAGQRDLAMEIPVGTFHKAGNYTMTMTVSIININHVVVWKVAKGKNFRIEPAPKGPAPVDLGLAGKFVILSKSGITDVPTSDVTGNVGTSPITGAADGLTCPEVTGKVYSVDAAGPAPCNIVDPVRLTVAVSDMEAAYTDAAGRTDPDYTELGAGDISGMTLTPGLYKWGTGVEINSDVYLDGGPNDVWIFQVAQGVTQASATRIHLIGGALAKNIFWQSFGVVSIGTTAHFEGVILASTAITLNTGATINGRLFAQTAVNLQSNVVTQPAP